MESRRDESTPNTTFQLLLAVYILGCPQWTWRRRVFERRVRDLESNDQQLEAFFGWRVVTMNRDKSSLHNGLGIMTSILGVE